MTQYIDLETIVGRIGLAMIYPDLSSTSDDPPDLVVSKAPQPYVPPKFRIITGSLDNAEVISIRAPAAVGKTVTAQFLSSQTGAPLIDLARTPVGAHSLRGMLSGYSTNPGAAIAAFHDGELPIVIDAIDEGVLLSGLASLESFIETSVEFISIGSANRDLVKLILLGRDDAIRSRSNLAIELLEADIAVCEVKLEFFERDSAIELVPLYARSELKRLADKGIITDSVRRRREAKLSEEPMKQLIDAHFQPIEFALGLPPGKLWEEEKGRAFAGYAPVLSSIGTLLAQIDNPVLVTNQLSQTGTAEAWKVIATVIEDILLREQGKLKERINYASRLTDPYGPAEQMTYLTQLFHNDSLTLVDTIDLDPSDEADYTTKVKQFCTEHPFVRDNRMANDVLGSKVFSHAVSNDLLEAYDLDLIKSLSRQPFLWRFIQGDMISARDAAEMLLIDGRYLGCVLASYWNDPIEPEGRKVRIRDAVGGDLDAELVEVTLNVDMANDEVSFQVMPPVTVYSCLQDADIRLQNAALVMEGSTGDASIFQFRGDNTVVSGEMTYACGSSSLDGALWLEAAQIDVAVSDPRISVVADAKYGWGDIVARVRPWRSLTDVSLLGPQDRGMMVALIEDCSRRIRNSVVVKSQYKLPEDDPAMNWARRVYGELFPAFLKLLVETNLVSRPRRKPTAGSTSFFTLNFGENFWENLLEAVYRRMAGQDQTDSKYVQFLEKCAADRRFELD